MSTEPAPTPAPYVPLSVRQARRWLDLHRATYPDVLITPLSPREVALDLIRSGIHYVSHTVPASGHEPHPTQEVPGLRQMLTGLQMLDEDPDE